VDKAKMVALIFVTASFGVSAVFAYGTATCGAMIQAPGGPPQCNGAVHPIAVVGLLGALACTVAVWNGSRLLTGIIGGTVTAFGVLVGLSAGYWGLIAGLLLVLASVPRVRQSVLPLI